MATSATAIEHVGAREHQWRSRPLVASGLKAVVMLVPIVIGSASALVLAKALPSPTTPIGTLLWWVAFAAGIVVPLVLFGRWAGRLLPLAALLQLSLSFKDAAPSRLTIARQAGRVRDLQAKLNEARSRGVDDEATRAAEKILALITALGLHDRKTRGHSERVRVLTDMIADERGISKEDRDRLRWSALLHDIGKLQVPNEILNKPAAPDEAEWDVIRRHPLEGARLVRPLMPYLGVWEGAIEHHHEHWDGTGYPRGLAAEEISMGGRILAVADAYETMTATRPYKKPISVPEARAELTAQAGLHFDPHIVRSFLNISIGRLWKAVGTAAFLAQIPMLGHLANNSFMQRFGSNVASAAGVAATVVAMAAGGVIPIGGFGTETGPAPVPVAAAASGGPVAAAPPAPKVAKAPRPPKSKSKVIESAPVVDQSLPPAAPARKTGASPDGDDKTHDPTVTTSYGRISGPNPVHPNEADVTRREFLRSCTEPQTQGLDAWVFRLSGPAPNNSSTRASGASSLGDHDLGLYFYAADCRPLGQIVSGSQDEQGPLPKGTVWVVASASSGVDTTVTLVVESERS